MRNMMCVTLLVKEAPAVFKITLLCTEMPDTFYHGELVILRKMTHGDLRENPLKSVVVFEETQTIPDIYNVERALNPEDHIRFYVRPIS
jgi:hypothetical protein